MLSKITGTGTGIAPVVNLTFGFLDKTHVKATVNGATAAFTWTGPTQITFSAVVGTGLPWVVYRDTPLTPPMVTFADGAVLTAGDLNLNNLQGLYIEQERKDVEDALVAVEPLGLTLVGKFVAPYGAFSFTAGEHISTAFDATGAIPGDFVILAPLGGDYRQVIWTAWVQTADQVWIDFVNQSTGTINIVAGSLTALVLRAS